MVRLSDKDYKPFISSLWDVKEPTHYSRRVAEVAGLGVNVSKKRLVVYEAT